MDFQKLLQNKPLLYGIIGAVVIILALAVTIGVAGSSNNSKNGTSVSEQPIKEDVNLLTTDNLGKALEIQSLLAKEGIAASRGLDGTKSNIYLKKATVLQVKRNVQQNNATAQL